MGITLHFFRSNQLDKLDFGSFLNFFTNNVNYKFYNLPTEEIEIEYRDPDFKFQYSLKLTKASQIQKIWRLDKNYVNMNIMIEIPLMISTYLAKEILKEVERICKEFDFYIYTSAFNDIKAFSMADMMILFQESRQEIVNKFGMQGKYYKPTKDIDIISRYQRTNVAVKDFFKNEYPSSDIVIPSAQVLVNPKSLEYGAAFVYQVGTESVLPLDPFFDYVCVVEDENYYFVTTTEFRTALNKLLIDVDNYLPGTYLLKGHNAKKAKGALQKLKKTVDLSLQFENIPLCSLIDCKVEDNLTNN